MAIEVVLKKYFTLEYIRHSNPMSSSVMEEKSSKSMAFPQTTQLEVDKLALLPWEGGADASDLMLRVGSVAATTARPTGWAKAYQVGQSLCRLTEQAPKQRIQSLEEKAGIFSTNKKNLEQKCSELQEHGKTFESLSVEYTKQNTKIAALMGLLTLVNQFNATTMGATPENRYANDVTKKLETDIATERSSLATMKEGLETEQGTLNKIIEETKGLKQALGTEAETLRQNANDVAQKIQESAVSNAALHAFDIMDKKRKLPDEFKKELIGIWEKYQKKSEELDNQIKAKTQETEKCVLDARATARDVECPEVKIPNNGIPVLNSEPINDRTGLNTEWQKVHDNVTAKIEEHEERVRKEQEEKARKEQEEEARKGKGAGARKKKRS